MLMLTVWLTSLLDTEAAKEIPMLAAKMRRTNLFMIALLLTLL